MLVRISRYVCSLGLSGQSYKAFADCSLEPPSSFFNMLEALPGIR